MWVLSLGWEDPLEEGMATHSSVLAWKIPWSEEPGGIQSIGSQRAGHDWSELGFPCGWAGKESACNVGDLGSIAGLRRSPGEGKGYPLQYCDLKNSIDCIIHGVTKSWTRLSGFHTSHTLLNRYLYLIHWMSISKNVFVTWIIFIFFNNAICVIPEDWVRTTF